MAGSLERHVLFIATFLMPVLGVDEIPCQEHGVTYEPLDIIHEGVRSPIHQPNISACQAHCKGTKQCWHFSYDVQNQLCHLEAIWAVKQYTRYGFVAGPRVCGEDIPPEK